MSAHSLTVAVGISGGVDSAVAALLLKQQDYKVFGLFMKNWEEDDDSEHCAATEDLAYATKVCEQLKIPLHTVNFSAEYWDRVFTETVAEYRAGRTPNPDVLCNQEIKFKEFLAHAQRLGADKIATGHYAGVEKIGSSYCLQKGLDAEKDQSYFLHKLNQSALANTLFPLADLHKDKIRDIAEQNEFANAERRDSTGICFIGERNFREFLARYIDIKPGEIIDEHGTVLGKHQGAWFYTIGQRQGLGIGGVKEKTEPWYVADKDLPNNRLIVVQGKEHQALYRTELWLEDLHWIAGAPDDLNGIKAKIRHRQQEQACTLSFESERWHVTFENPQWAVTPGQYAVFYRDRYCLGGGIITTPDVIPAKAGNQSKNCPKDTLLK